MYCVESPESWFEVFGTAQLNRGQARVTLDPAFAALVHLDVYFVFVTPEGSCQGLYVKNKTPRGFDVFELQGGKSSILFSFRVVARRGDVRGPRLERVKLQSLEVRELRRTIETPPQT